MEFLRLPAMSTHAAPVANFALPQNHRMPVPHPLPLSAPGKSATLLCRAIKVARSSPLLAFGALLPFTLKDGPQPMPAVHNAQGHPFKGSLYTTVLIPAHRGKIWNTSNTFCLY